MLLGINLSKYVSEGIEFSTGLVNRCIEDEVFYILDTDDLVVESASSTFLKALLKTNSDIIQNLKLRGDSIVYTFSDPLDLIYVGGDVKLWGGRVVLHNEVLLEGDSFKSVCETITITNVPHMIGIYNKKECCYDIRLDEKLVISFKTKSVMYSYMHGIPYLYRMGNYLVVYFTVYHINRYHCVTFIFDISGEVIDVFTLDNAFFGEVDFVSQDIKFRTKWISMQKERY